MKKYIISLFLVLCLVGYVSAGMIIQKFSTSCDDCSGSLVMAVHFEDNTGSNLETGTPCGCSDGSDKTYSLTGGASHSSAQKSDGTYSCLANTEDDATEIDNTGIAAAVSSVGTHCVDYYKSVAGNGRIMSIGITGDVTDGGGSNDNTITISYGGGSLVGTDTFNDSTWTRICFSWDESQGNLADLLAVKVGSNSWETKTNINLVDPGLAAPLYVVSGNWQYGRGYFDNIKIYSTYQAE